MNVKQEMRDGKSPESRLRDLPLLTVTVGGRDDLRR